MLAKVSAVTNSQEHFFEGSDRNAIAGYAKLVQVLVKLLEEIFEFRRVLYRNLKGNLPCDLAQLKYFLT